MAYEDSENGCWETVGSEGDGGPYSEYATICTGAELENSRQRTGPGSRASTGRLPRKTTRFWRGPWHQPGKPAPLVLHTDNQGFVTGEEATEEELAAWLDCLAVGVEGQETLIDCPDCGMEVPDTEEARLEHHDEEHGQEENLVATRRPTAGTPTPVTS